MDLLRASVKQYSETKAQVDVAVATARTQRLAEEAEEAAAVGDAQLQQKVRRDDTDGRHQSGRTHISNYLAPLSCVSCSPHPLFSLKGPRASAGLAGGSSTVG